MSCSAARDTVTAALGVPYGWCVREASVGATRWCAEAGVMARIAGSREDSGASRVFLSSGT